MNGFTKQEIKTAVRQYAPMMLGLRIPGFIKIHLRYIRRDTLTWFVLFIAPFVIGVMTLSVLCEKLLEIDASDLQIFLVVLFIIALAFFFAERHRKFRRFYVMAIPILVIANGLFRLNYSGGVGIGRIIGFGIVTLLPAWWVGRHAMGKGYNLLSDGADKDYRPGRDLYMEEQYAQAFVHLEPSAKRGHMKSLYLLGHAHQNGNGRNHDRVKAARFYDKSSRKGYGKAKRAFDDLFDSFSQEEITAFETDFSTSGLNELF